MNTVCMLWFLNCGFLGMCPAVGLLGYGSFIPSVLRNPYTVLFLVVVSALRLPTNSAKGSVSPHSQPTFAAEIFLLMGYLIHENIIVALI